MKKMNLFVIIFYLFLLMPVSNKQGDHFMID